MIMIENLINQIDAQKTFGTIAKVKAKTILDSCNQQTVISHNDSFLCIGPNVIAYGLANEGYDVTVVEGLNHPHDNIKFLQGSVFDIEAQYDYVIAADEWLIRASTEQDQLDKIALIKKLTRKGFYTTLKDYKNMSMRDRFFYEPFELHTDSGSHIIIRKRDWSKTDRQRWIDRTYIIYNNELSVSPAVECRTMYFKQLAKFSHDAGAKEFLVEKKTMYKPLFSKVFEYIVYVGF